MKAKNFRNGTEVRIKPSATEIAVPSCMVGKTGVLMSVTREATGQLVGRVGVWLVRPEHVSLVNKPEPEVIATHPIFESVGSADANHLAPGFYTDGDGYLWIVAGEPLRVNSLIDFGNIERGIIDQVYLSEGETVPEFFEVWSDEAPAWWPLVKVADLPKPDVWGGDDRARQELRVVIE